MASVKRRRKNEPAARKLMEYEDGDFIANDLEQLQREIKMEDNERQPALDQCKNVECSRPVDNVQHEQSTPASSGTDGDTLPANTTSDYCNWETQYHPADDTVDDDSTHATTHIGPLHLQYFSIKNRPVCACGSKGEIRKSFSGVEYLWRCPKTGCRHKYLGLSNEDDYKIWKQMVPGAPSVRPVVMIPVVKPKLQYFTIEARPTCDNCGAMSTLIFNNYNYYWCCPNKHSGCRNSLGVSNQDDYEIWKRMEHSQQQIQRGTSKLHYFAIKDRPKNVPVRYLEKLARSPQGMDKFYNRDSSICKKCGSESSLHNSYRKRYIWRCSKPVCQITLGLSNEDDFKMWKAGLSGGSHRELDMQQSTSQRAKQAEAKRHADEDGGKSAEASADNPLEQFLNFCDNQ